MRHSDKWHHWTPHSLPSIPWHPFLHPCTRARARERTLTHLHLHNKIQAVHKIQSADGPLALNLSKVPKMLGVLRGTWAPGAFVVSFKLETDESILLSKVRAAQRRARGGGDVEL